MVFVPFGVTTFNVNQIPSQQMASEVGGLLEVLDSLEDAEEARTPEIRELQEFVQKLQQIRLLPELIEHLSGLTLLQLARANSRLLDGLYAGLHGTPPGPPGTNTVSPSPEIDRPKKFYERVISSGFYPETLRYLLERFPREDLSDYLKLAAGSAEHLSFLLKCGSCDNIYTKWLATKELFSVLSSPGNLESLKLFISYSEDKLKDPDFREKAGPGYLHSFCRTGTTAAGCNQHYLEAALESAFIVRSLTISQREELSELEQKGIEVTLETEPPWGLDPQDPTIAWIYNKIGESPLPEPFFNSIRYIKSLSLRHWDLLLSLEKRLPSQKLPVYEKSQQEVFRERIDELIFHQSQELTEQPWALRFLFERGIGLDPDQLSRFLKYAITTPSKPAVIKLLIQRGADPNRRVPGVNHPLITAMVSGDVQALKLLLDYGARPEGVVLNHIHLDSFRDLEKIGVLYSHPRASASLYCIVNYLLAYIRCLQEEDKSKAIKALGDQETLGYQGGVVLAYQVGDSRDRLEDILEFLFTKPGVEVKDNPRLKGPVRSWAAPGVFESLGGKWGLFNEERRQWVLRKLVDNGFIPLVEDLANLVKCGCPETAVWLKQFK